MSNRIDDFGIQMIKYSELFYSLQGEGRFVGVPSIFLRFFGCNMQCPGFGRDGDSTPIDYKSDLQIETLEDAPIPNLGCDSAMSWSKEFAHLAKKDLPSTIAQKIVDLLPSKSWQRNENVNDVHLVFTGGEPLLKGNQEDIMQLIMLLPGLKNVTFETNGTQVISEEMIDFFNYDRPDIHVTFSVSPKLKNSGEEYDKAFNHHALKIMNVVGNSYTYIKAVLSKVEQFDELQEWIDMYYKRFVKLDAIYVMPEGATVEQQNNYAEIANECLKREVYFRPRLHIDLWGNKWGT